MSDLYKPLDHFLELLNQGHKLSLVDIREKVGAGSNRQIQRWVTILRGRGIQIQEEYHGRFKSFFIAEKRLKKSIRIDLNEEEILALSVATQVARAVLDPSPLQLPLHSALDKLVAELATQPVSFDVSEEKYQWHFGAAPSVPIDQSVFEELRNAIEDHITIRIDYYSASSNRQWLGREVDPYGLAVRSGSWLLVAYCHMRKRVTDFSLVDISRVSPTGHIHPFFTVPDGFSLDGHFRDRFNALAGGEIYVVRMLVEPDRARYFHRKEYHPTQQIEEERADGRLVVSYEVTGLEEIRSFVQGWGVGVMVLDPPELVSRLRSEAEHISRRYLGINDNRL